MRTKAIRPTTLGSVSLGATFVFRTVEILGAEYATSFKVPFEGQMLAVVGFKPRYVNQVVVRDPKGCESLLPLYMVEKALTLQAHQVDTDESQQLGRELSAIGVCPDVQMEPR